MGGDHAPAPIVAGAVRAARELPHELILVGQREPVERELSRYHNRPRNLSLHHASEVIDMHESITSVRHKRDASINVGMELVHTRRADAFVSAGNTSAMVGSASLTLGMLPGIERPGIGIVLLSPKGETFFIDAGANIDPKPPHLLQYAIMASIYARYAMNKPNPTVGLLNVGEEATKGTDFIKEAYRLIAEEKQVNFVGNVEGRDIFAGTCDVIVCDGFVGNVALKTSESLADAIGVSLKRALAMSPITRLGAFLSRDAFKAVRKEIDYAEYGGAPLLGVNGVVIISHGASSGKAIKNAILAAASLVEHNVNHTIVTALRSSLEPKPTT